MKYDAQNHHRRSIRLKGYDYSLPGAYLVTIVTWQRIELFGKVVDGAMQLSEVGWIIDREWARTPKIRPEIELGDWVVMPNHIHGILVIHDGAHIRAPLRAPEGQSTIPQRSANTLGSIIAGFKSAATIQVNVHRNTPGKPVWQRNYFEHIIRSQAEWQQISLYIQSNPLQWNEDQLHPES